MNLALWGKVGQSVYTSVYIKKEESGIVKMLSKLACHPNSFQLMALCQ